MKQTIILLLFVIGLASCGSSKKTTQEISKSDMIAKWSVETIAGFDKPTTGLTMSLNLIENTVSGFAGCNKYSGNAVREDSKISFPLLMNTQMVCEKSDIENAYMKALSKVHSFEIKKNILTFYNQSGKPEITFTKMSR